jgi:hypothetical protein
MINGLSSWSSGKFEDFEFRPKLRSSDYQVRHRRVCFELEAALRIPFDIRTKRNDRGNPGRGQDESFDFRLQ